VIDFASLTLAHRVPPPGCDHGHGVAVDADKGLRFIGCEDNAMVVTVDLVVEHSDVSRISISDWLPFGQEIATVEDWKL
jgi:hypothetical protein